jgi:carbon storage regulator
MLVLTRKSSESVMLGNFAGLEHTIKITVMRIRGNEVRLGFESTREVLIHRLEVWERTRSRHDAIEKHDTERIGVNARDIGAFGRLYEAGESR